MVHDREATPSFALLDVQGPVIVTYVYQLVEGEVRPAIHEQRTCLGCAHDGQVKVDKVEDRRPSPPRDETVQDKRAEVPVGW